MTLYGIGVGPGDPELMTVKAVRVLRACPTVAWFAATGRSSNARAAASPYIEADHEELALFFPVTTEPVEGGAAEYQRLLADFYDQSAKRIAETLDSAADVAVLCEGDPLLYGSFMYLHALLRDRYQCEIVPGVTSATAAAASAAAPLACRDESVAFLTGTMARADLEARLRSADAAVIVKIGRHLEKVKDALRAAGLVDRALYAERVTTLSERIVPLEGFSGPAPYFSLVLVPSAIALRL